MASALMGAHQALNAANETLGRQKEKPLIGRRFSHWSFYALLTGTLVGAIGIIAASVLAMYPLIAAASLLFVSNALGAYYIRKFDRLRDLEDYVNILSQRIQEMATQLKTLQQTKEELQHTAADLDKNVQKTVKVWDKGASDVQKQAQELEKTREKLVETEKMMRTYRDLYQNLSKSVGKFSTNVAEFNKSSQVFDQHIDNLSQKVAARQQVIDQLHNVDEELDKDMKSYEDLNKANLKFLTSFQQQLSNIQAFHKNAQELKESIEKKAEQVDKASAKAAEALKGLETIAVQENAQNDEFAKRLKILEKFQQKILKLK